ncbi:helix-turn-helix domain-containing protein [Photobacterium lutimaris]|uniref:AraC family transcriptional regulator n=1 Tax=Photobacterium lutimaris TaxID=388278 RepID=A0A2T3J4T9_9GAMM|nr:helix-turn-helix domain-containing protein [Photobacterium lutimaris]PSU36291.1 AraC family transcriptional regulator [Photobacterium lutimaris]TDR74824.1 AraC family transcriptional regulator [Photobacterium lutimaris]
MQQGQLVPLIKTINASTIIALITHFEKDIYPLLSAAGIPDDILQQNHEYLPEAPIKNLLGMMAERAEPEFYGELLCTAIREYFLPKMLSYLDQPSTIAEAIEQMRTAVLHDSPTTQLRIEIFNDTPWLCRYKPLEDSDGYLWSEIFAILFLIEFIRYASKKNWSPAYIAMQSDGADKLSRILQSKETTFYTKRKIAAVALSDEILNLPYYSAASFTVSAPSSISPKEISYIESIYHALAPYLCKQSMTITEAAKILGTTPRTLQRRLSQEHTSFKHIRENIMLATACRLMEEKAYSLTDIAVELGYADIAHFSRAFRKLTGFPPKDYRKQFVS